MFCSEKAFVPKKLAPQDRVLQSEGAPHRPTSTIYVAISNYQVPAVLQCRWYLQHCHLKTIASTEKCKKKIIKQHDILPCTPASVIKVVWYPYLIIELQHLESGGDLRGRVQGAWLIGLGDLASGNTPAGLCPRAARLFGELTLIIEWSPRTGSQRPSRSDPRCGTDVLG